MGRGGDVRAGDDLLLRDGRIVVVAAVRHEPFQGKVYNFSVAELESYAVGHNNVLVHNTGTCPGAPSAVQTPGSYLAGKAPRQVTPGTRVLEGQYVNDLGRVEPWTSHYDEYGRLIGRTDFNAGNRCRHPGYSLPHL